MEKNNEKIHVSMYQFKANTRSFSKKFFDTRNNLKTLTEEETEEYSSAKEKLISDCRSPTSFDLCRKLNKMNDPYKKNPDNNELHSLICAIDKLQEKLVALGDDFQLYGDCDTK